VKRTRPLLNKSLVIKDYLETASDASRRTRFITIIMLVASVLALVSILNSADFGWITLRLRALRHKTSPYTIRKFPLLCECDEQVQRERRELCESLENEEGTKDLLWKIKTINKELEDLDNNWAINQTERNSRKKELETEKRTLCNEEIQKLNSLYDTMQKSASEVKYTVRVPFFGIAFDINDIGILGGFSLWVILVLLRISLRHQIISLRIGFKEAFACDQEKDFYQILAARQVFVFPPLSDPKQSAEVSFGWIELWWRQSEFYILYHELRMRFLRQFSEMRKMALIILKIKQEPKIHKPKQETEIGPSTSNVGHKDEWQANRNISLRLVPKFLSLVPFLIYLFQYIFDFYSRNYGYELSVTRTLILLSLGAFFLLNLFVLGVWCITKWNELDRLWDYYYHHIKNETKPGRIHFTSGRYSGGIVK
jgi:hypothetical protein